MSDTYQSKYTGVEIDERLEWAEEISPHIAKQLNTETGIHGIRFWQNKLEYNDGAGWVEIETGGGGSFVVKGLYANLSALIAAHPTGEAGDAYAVGSAEDNDIYIWSIVSSAWVNIGPLRGEKSAENISYDNEESELEAGNVQDAIDEVADLVSTHTAKTDNPHSVTKSQVGLSNVTNESKTTMFTNPNFTGTPTTSGNMMYHAGNVTISTTAPTEALPEGHIHMTY